MSSTPYTFEVRSSGTLTAGLTPSWSSLKKLSDGTDVASPNAVAVITELGGGLYKVAYDPEGVNGELAGVIDAGASITAAADRYITMVLAQDSSRVARLDATIASRSSHSAADTATAVWAAATRTLTAISDSSGVTTLLERITTGRMTLLDRLATMIEQIGTSGVYRFLTGALTQAPTGAGQLVQGQFKLVADEAGADGVLESYLGDTRTLRCQLTDGAGVGIDLTGSTLTAKLVDLAGTMVLDSAVVEDGLTLTSILSSEGRVEIVLPLSDIDLVAGRRYKLLVYRTVSSRRSTFPLDVLIGG